MKICFKLDLKEVSSFEESESVRASKKKNNFGQALIWVILTTLVHRKDLGVGRRGRGCPKSVKG
jgi:hypothetical protein